MSTLTYTLILITVLVVGAFTAAYSSNQPNSTVCLKVNT